MSNAVLLAAQVARLRAAITNRVDSVEHKACEDLHHASLPLLEWLEFLQASEVTGCCDEQLAALRASLVETCGCLTLGLVRPTLFSLRSQIDIAFAWLYFKDHPIEWNTVITYGEGFLLKKEIFDYLENNFRGFKLRFQVLLKHKKRTSEDPYRLLSAHIHSQGMSTMPTYEHLEALVGGESLFLDCLELQKEVAEYIGDIFLSIFSHKWASLPDGIMLSAKQRLSGTDLGDVFGPEIKAFGRRQRNK
jgi:hypothetical protein